MKLRLLASLALWLAAFPALAQSPLPDIKGPFDAATDIARENDLRRAINANFALIGQGGSGVTSVTCGTGLSGGVITTTGTCTVATGGVTGAMLATSAAATNLGIGAPMLSFFTIPSSANLAGALTDETGTGFAVFSASPAFTGTPTAPTASLGTNTTQLATTAFVLANGGGGGSSTGFGVQTGQVPATVANANSAIAAGKYKVTISAALTAPRTYTLPDNATFGVGCMIFGDPLGTITSTNTATLTKAGSDTVNGGTSLVIGIPFGSLTLCADGAGAWTSFGGNGIAALASSSNTFLTGLGTDGNFTRAQPSSSNLSDASNLPLINGTNVFTGTNTFGTVKGAVNAQSGTTYILAATDCGKTIVATNGSEITVTTLNSIPAGCAIAIEQGGAGQVVIANGSGATLTSAHSYTKTFNAVGAMIGLYIDTNSGTNAHYVLTGDGA